MNDLLKTIVNNHLDDRFDNKNLIQSLSDLDWRQLFVVMSRIKEVEEKFGEPCRLIRIVESDTDLSIFTDNPNDNGVTVGSSVYRKKLSVN